MLARHETKAILAPDTNKSGLHITQPDTFPDDHPRATRRIWRTADGRHVTEGHPDAWILAAAIGDPIPYDVTTIEEA